MTRLGEGRERERERESFLASSYISLSHLKIFLLVLHQTIIVYVGYIFVE